MISLRLPGIAPEEADRIMAMIDELTTEDGGTEAGESRGAAGGRADVVNAALRERKLLGLIGLGVRGRGAVVGVEQVRMAAQRGTLALAVVAPDASANSRKKVLPLLMAKKIFVVEGPPAAVLGSAVGRDSAAAVGIVDRNLARGIRAVAGTGSPEPRGRKA